MFLKHRKILHFVEEICLFGIFVVFSVVFFLLLFMLHPFFGRRSGGLLPRAVGAFVLAEQMSFGRRRLGKTGGYGFFLFVGMFVGWYVCFYIICLIASLLFVAFWSAL